MRDNFFGFNHDIYSQFFKLKNLNNTNKSDKIEEFFLKMIINGTIFNRVIKSLDKFINGRLYR